MRGLVRGVRRAGGWAAYAPNVAKSAGCRSLVKKKSSFCAERQSGRGSRRRGASPCRCCGGVSRGCGGWRADSQILFDVGEVGQLGLDAVTGGRSSGQRKVRGHPSRTY